MFLHVFIFAYSSVSFYFAVRNIININQIDYTQYNYALNDTQNAESIRVAAMVKKNDLIILKTACESARYQVSQVVIPNVTYYNELVAENKTCQDNLDTLNRTLNEIKNNGTTTVLWEGTCQFINGTLVNYAYKRFTLNTYDFYYYIFPTSIPVFTNSSTVYIDNCLPIIFQGTPLTKKTYTSGLILTGGVSYLEIGQEKLRIELVTGMQNVQLDNFQIIN